MERRLAKLQTIWPPEACRACEKRPAIVCIAREDDPVPDYPEGRCAMCGRLLTTVPILVGIRCEDL
jgi:hypothetical protein